MSAFDESKVLFSETLPGAWNWSHNLKAGTSLRITDIEGGANVSCLLFNARNYTERYNMADTLKAQFISYLTRGNVCYSDMGRVLLSITEDTCGWHDPISGVSTARDVAGKYGIRTYQESRNNYLRNGFDSLLVEIAKYGMSTRDFHAGINFFSRVNVTEDGAMIFVPDNSTPGSIINLQAEMETLIVLNSCPHPLNPATEWSPKPVELTVWESRIPFEDNECRTSCEQNERGFINTRNYLF
jgi:uncharacterized protein